METKRELFQTTNGRRARMIWPIAVPLIAGAIGIIMVVVPLMTRKDVPLTRVPSTKPEPSPMDLLSDRLDSAERKLTAGQTDRVGLTDRISQIDKTLTTGIRRARAETTALVEGVKRDMGRSFEAVHSRLTGIESLQSETLSEVARLQSDLTAVRRELESLREASDRQAGKVAQIEQEQLSTQSEVSGMQNESLANLRRVDALAYQVERENVGFEVSKEGTEEVVPGIFLTINRTNVSKQQVDGWLQISTEGRFIWLQDAGAQHSISFSSRIDERPYHLVFTRVSDGGVAGYLLVPTQTATIQTAAK